MGVDSVRGLASPGLGFRVIPKCSFAVSFGVVVFFGFRVWGVGSGC